MWCVRTAGCATKEERRPQRAVPLYFGSRLTPTAFYERHQISNPLTPNAPLAATRRDWTVGGAYDFRVAQAFLSDGQSSTDDSHEKAKTAQRGASVPLGGGKVLASYAQTQRSLANVLRKTLTIGYDYELPKRTDAYARGMNDRITNVDSGTSLAVGIRTASDGASAAGVDVPRGAEVSKKRAPCACIAWV